MWLLSVGPDHGRGGFTGAHEKSLRERHQPRNHQYLPLWYLSTDADRDPPGRRVGEKLTGRTGGGDAMAMDHTITRRQFMITTAVVGGAFVLGFALPSRQAEAAAIAEQPWTPPTSGGSEINAWLVIGNDDSVTIRVAQSEMGEGVFTSMPMLV